MTYLEKIMKGNRVHYKMVYLKCVSVLVVFSEKEGERKEGKNYLAGH